MICRMMIVISLFWFTIISGAELTQSIQEVELTDLSSNPVVGASVTLTHVLLENGKDVAVEGFAPLKTDDKGSVKLVYPIEMGQQKTSSGVVFRIEHPDFLVEVVAKKLAPVLWIRLNEGTRVELTAVNVNHQSITDFEIFVGDKVQPMKALVEPDRFYTSVDDGDRQAMLVKIVPNGKHLFSGVFPIRASQGRIIRLRKVPVRPGVRIEGRLSDAVPRPIKNGYAVLTSVPVPLPKDHRVNRRDRKFIAWSTTVLVDEDGSFVVGSMPSGELLQVSAFCDGWISTSSDPKKKTMKPIEFDLAELMTDGRASLSVDMQPLQNLAIRVVDPEGKPVKDGILYRSFLQTTFNDVNAPLGMPKNTLDLFSSSKAGKTQDAGVDLLRKRCQANMRHFSSTAKIRDGQAVLENVPSDIQLRILVEHPKWQSPALLKAGVDISPSEGEPLEIQLVERPDP